MTFADAISARILDLLEKYKLNVNQLAISAGINESTIRSVLNKSTKCPRASTIRYICIGFKISMSDFYSSELFNEDNIIDD